MKHGFKNKSHRDHEKPRGRCHFRKENLQEYDFNIPKNDLVVKQITNARQASALLGRIRPKSELRSNA